MGPMLKSTVEAGQRAVEVKSMPWKITVETFFQPVSDTKKLFARLLNTDSESIALVPSASYGAAVAAKNLDGLEVGEILLLEDQFPSHFYSWKSLCKKDGHKLVTLKKSMGENITEKILERMSSKTRILCLPHVHWCDGVMLNLELISERAHNLGAHLVLDLTQSLGAVPIDFQKVKPDFAFAANYKWMLGPYSTGCLYVAPQYWKHGVPLEENWTNRKGYADFKNLVHYQENYEDGAQRFDMGEKSQMHSLPMVIDALENILAWTPEALSLHCRTWNEQLVERLNEYEDLFHFWDTDQRSPNILGISFENVDFLEEKKEELISKNIMVSYRGQSMRVSPHIFNTLDQVEKIFEVLRPD